MERSARPPLSQTLLAATLLALLFASYGILKPLRDNVGQSIGRWDLPDIWLGTAVVTALATAVLGWAVSRWPRRTFAPWAFATFALVTGAAYLLFDAHGDGTVRVDDDALGFWLAAAFYWWVSSYLPLGLALFWGLMADLHDDRQGRWVFGPIAFAGTLGQLGGAATTKELARAIGLLPLLATAVSVLVLAAVVCVALLRTAAARSDAPRAAPRPAVGGHWWDGFVTAVRSPFLGSILAYVALQTFLSAALSLEVVEIVRAHFGNDAAGQRARTAFNGSVDFWSQAAALTIQFALVGPLLRSAGVGVALALQPLVFAAGLAAMTWCSLQSAGAMLAVVATVDAARRAVNYGFAKPSRDLLFTACTPSERYKTKAAIDAAGFRAFDWVSGVVMNGWRMYVETLGKTAALVIPVALGWAWLAGALGRMHRRRLAGGGGEPGAR